MDTVQGQAFVHQHNEHIPVSHNECEAKNLNAFLQIFDLLHLIKCPANAQAQHLSACVMSQKM